MAGKIRITPLDKSERRAIWARVKKLNPPTLEVMAGREGDDSRMTYTLGPADEENRIFQVSPKTLYSLVDILITEAYATQVDDNKIDYNELLDFSDTLIRMIKDIG